MPVWSGFVAFALFCAIAHATDQDRTPVAPPNAPRKVEFARNSAHLVRPASANRSADTEALVIKDALPIGISPNTSLVKPKLSGVGKRLRTAINANQIL